MKRAIVLMVVVACFVTLSAFEDGTVVSLGGGMSWLTGIPGDTQNGMMGLTGGLSYLKYYCEGTRVFEPGVRWKQRGQSADAGDPVVTTDVTTSFLDLFVKSKCVYGQGNFSFQPFFGANVGFLMIASAEDADGNITNCRGDYKTPMFSLLLGTDFQLWEDFIVGLEFDYGLTFVFDKRDVPNNKVTSNTAGLNLGWKF